MIGVLRIIQVHDCEGHPVIMLQMKGVDPAGIERDVVFEYELSFNFVFEQDLTRTFSALSIKKGEYIGFLFDSNDDKEDFNGHMLAIASQLRMPKASYEDLKRQIVAKQQEEQQAELES